MNNYSWSSSYPPELKESMQGWKGYRLANTQGTGG